MASTAVDDVRDVLERNGQCAVLVVVELDDNSLRRG